MAIGLRCLCLPGEGWPVVRGAHWALPFWPWSSWNLFFTPPTLSFIAGLVARNPGVILESTLSAMAPCPVGHQVLVMPSLRPHKPSPFSLVLLPISSSQLPPLPIPPGSCFPDPETTSGPPLCIAMEPLLFKIKFQSLYDLFLSSPSAELLSMRIRDQLHLTNNA